MSETNQPTGASWDMLEMAQSQSEHWQEFFRVPSMSMGLYQLKAGDTDPQLPHSEDEAYYIIRGKSQIQVEDTVYDCRAGTVIFVAKNANHKFINIEEDLTILVFFAPAEGSLRSQDV